MIAVMIIWFYILFLLFVFGTCTGDLLRKLFGLTKETPIPFSLVAMAGLGTLTTVIGYLAMFMNIALVANVLLLAIALGLGIARYRRLKHILSTYIAESRTMDKWLGVLFLFVGILILIRTAGVARSYDTGLYHAQSIQWIEEYGLVPGLANLHGRFGFNSSWFLPHALFSFSFVRTEPFHVLSGLVLLLVVGYALRPFGKLMHKGHIPSLTLGIAILGIGIPLLAPLASSPDINTSVSLTLWLIFMLAIDTFVEQTEFGTGHLLIFLLACFAVTLKLSAMPILIFPAYVLWLAGSKRKTNAFTFSVLAAFIFLPWVTKNIVQSGYLLYPYPSIDLFNFDWKVPTEYALLDKQWIESWARVPQLPPAQVLSMPLSEWLPLWWQTRPIHDKLLAAWLLLSACIDSIYLVININSLSDIHAQNKKYVVPFLAALSGTLFVLWTAPNLGFGYGFMIVLGIMLAAPLFRRIYSTLQSRMFPLLLVCLMMELILVYRTINDPTVIQHLVFPATYPRPETISVNVQNLQVNVPSVGDQCWMAPLPCTPSPDPRLEMRGSTFAEGFRMSKP